MDSLELQLSDEGDDLSEITVRRGDSNEIVWAAGGAPPVPLDMRGGKKSPVREEKVAPEVSRASPERVVPTPMVNGGSSSGQGSPEGRERAVPVEAVQLPVAASVSAEQQLAPGSAAKKKKARKKRPE